MFKRCEDCRKLCIKWFMFRLADKCAMRVDYVCSNCEIIRSKKRWIELIRDWQLKGKNDDNEF